MIFLIVLATVSVQDVPIPQALLAFQKQREETVGTLRWNVELRESSTRTSHISRYARNGDWIYENRGDQDGWTMGQTTKFPQLHLSNADGYWHYQETGASAAFWRANQDVDAEQPSQLEWARDVRALGTLPWSSNLQADHGVSKLTDVPVGAGPPEWREERSGDLTVVTADFSDGRRLRWYINASKGWNAERVTEEFNGRVVTEAVSTLEQIGERWFPRRVDYFRGGVLKETVSVELADLDVETAAPRFSPRELGLEPGVNIKAKNFQPEVNALIWDGDQTVPIDTWIEEMRAGRKKRGPIMERLYQSDGRFDSPYLTEEQRVKIDVAWHKLQAWGRSVQRQSLWEEYVKSFILRYRLDAEQASKAWAIYAQCRDQADNHLNRKKDDIERTEKERETATEKRDTEAVKRASDKLAELLTPLEEIFNEKLKPRLDRLPTRAQRKAVEEAEKPAQPATATKP